MASFVWPPGLPQVPQRGYTEELGVSVLRTAMDLGPAKLRRRGVRPDVLNVNFLMTGSQVEILENFINNTVQGTARFNFPHPRKQTFTEQTLAPGSYLEYSRESLSSFNRSSTATYIDSITKQLKTALVDEPREEWNRLLVEPGSTNLALYSELATNAYWTKSNVTASETLEINPVGLANSSLIVANNLTTTKSINRNFTVVAGEYYWHSVFVKAKDGLAGVALNALDAQFGSGSDLRYIFASNLSIAGANTRTSIQKLSNDWYRISAGYNCITSGNTTFTVSLLPVDGAVTTTWAGDNLIGAYIFGQQVEKYDNIGVAPYYPSSYIPSTETPSTRTEDIAKIAVYTDEKNFPEVRIVPKEGGTYFNLQYAAPDYYTVTLQLEILP